MRIGDVAERAGVGPRAPRYDEERDLLPAERSPSGQRHHTEAAVERVRLIQRLPCVHTGMAAPAQLDLLTTQRDRIDRQVEDLATARDQLDAVIASATASMSAGRASCDQV